MSHEFTSDPVPHHEIQLNPEMIRKLYSDLAYVSYTEVQVYDGTYVSICKENNAFVRVRNYDGEVLAYFDSGHSRSIRRIEVWQGKKLHIITASNDGTAKAFDMKGKLLRTLTPSKENVKVTCIKSSVDTDEYGTATVISGSDDGTVKLWGLKSGKAKFNCVGHTSSIRAVSFSETRQFGEIIFSSIDSAGALRLWSYDNGACLRVLGLHPAPEPVLAIANGESKDYCNSGIIVER